MSSYFDLFYTRVQTFADRYDVLLTPEERYALRDVRQARHAFADMPLYVTAVPGLREALHSSKEVRAERLMEVVDRETSEPDGLLRGLDVTRIRELSAQDRDIIASQLAAFYFLAESALGTNENESPQ